MIRIALCDDEAKQREIMISMLNAWQKSRSLSLQYEAFSSPPDLLDAAAKQDFDLFLLDVVMPGMTGIDLGLRLRKMHSGALIIYLSTSPDFAVDSYRVRAHNYLLKPLKQESLFEALDEAHLQLSSRRSAAISVRSHGMTLRLEADQILYAELYNRAVRYCLQNGSTVDSVSLRTPFHAAVAPLLEEKNFVMCGASFAVNLEQVASVDKDGVVFKNGIRLSLSKKACSTLRSEWMNYWLEVD